MSMRIVNLCPRQFFFLSLSLLFMLACRHEKFVGSLSDYTGEKSGTVKTYFDNGQLREEGQFDNGNLDGYRKIYHPDGYLEVIEHYRQGEFHGTYQKFYSDGQVSVAGEYIDGVMKGVWKTFYPSGQLKDEVMMSDNEENGPFTEYYENGQLKAEGTYLSGENEHGPLKLYNEDGVLIRTMDCNQGICHTTWKIDTDTSTIR